jgi:DNA-binding CsgD family transcriptional regulator
MSNELAHIGMPRRSGRYPWGSGENGYQRSIGWRGHIQSLKAQGMSDVEIANAEGITTTQLRARNSIAKYEVAAAERAEALRLKDKGLSNMEIGRQMGKNESSVRNLLDPVLAERSEIIMTTAQMLKDQVAKKGYIDIGAGVEPHVGVSRDKLNKAVSILEEEGYQVQTVNVDQIGMPGKFTIVKALAPPTDNPKQQWRELVNDPSKIQVIDMVSNDYGRTYDRASSGVFDPSKVQNVDSSRIQVRYHGEGGESKDGVIELRRGVSDLDLGGSQYAQVRVGVDGTHYLKGMAIYSDNMPDGVDIIFNTNKTTTGNKLDAMKKFKDDPDNPFGSSIKTFGQRGALNIVNEEGDWETWSKTLSSQVLSKQTAPLAKRQLDLGYQEKKEEYEELSALTNPVVKKQLLLAFADDCDSSSVHLKAAGLPRQASKVILPIPELKETEVYAPTFNNGEAVVLIRHPHGGTFEIPQVIVNNNSKAAKAIMANAKDAIGINPKVAQKLSGADFDGDTVIVIPNNTGLIKTSASLKGLENFDPVTAYPPFDGMRTIDGGTYNAKTREVDYGGKKPKSQTKQTQMGIVSNLITDMTIKGANLDEIARAVRHSMVVIDSEKHHLNYKQSRIDNGIDALAAKYQRSSQGGASTIISRAGSEYRVDERKSTVIIDPNTGKKTYRTTGASYEKMKLVTDPATGQPVIDPSTGKKIYVSTGKIITKKTKSTQMAEYDDAYELSSGRQIEQVYAGYANSMKALANQARKEAVAIVPTPYSPSAHEVYAKEVARLEADLKIALMNKPIERQAQIIANSIVDRTKEANPGMDSDDLKKARNRALAEGRARTGAKKNLVDIDGDEWAAIQAGAISPSKLSQILQNANLDQIKQLATPRSTTTLSPARLQRAQSMLNAGLTQAEVAEALGVSTSTLSKALK